MMNTTLAPPTTVNTLNRHEKARLVRSTRKLEAILGTTPHLTEVEPIHITLPPMNPPPSPRTKAARRHGSIFTVFPAISLPDDTSVYSSSSSNSSLSSLTLLQDDEPRVSAETLPTPRSFSSRPRRCADAPPPLHLRVNTVPASPSDSRIPRSPVSPFVAAPAQPVTPITPELPPRLSEVEMRRKRMAKLARTFGETVPAEYVFPSTAATRPRNIPVETAQTRHARTGTLPHVAVTISSNHARRSSQVWTTGDQGGFWSGQWNRKDIREVQHKLRTLRAK